MSENLRSLEVSGQHSKFSFDLLLFEKLRIAEERVSLVRLFTILFNSFFYVLIMPHDGTIEWLAYSIVVIALLYALYVWHFKPYEQYPVLLTSYYTSVSDGLLITLWLWATGGFDSPFYLLWYVSITAISFRFPLKTTLWVSGIYSVLYLGIVVLDIGLMEEWITTSIRIGYIFLVGGLSGLVSSEVVQQMARRFEARHSEQRAKEAEKKSSNAVKRLRREIVVRRAAEQRFKDLLESAPDAMVIVDEGGNIILVNKQTEKLFGYPRQEILKQPVEKLIPSRFSKKHIKHRQDYIKDPQVRPMGMGLELWGLRKDGAEFPIEISLAPLKAENETFVSASIRDVTTQKKDRQALEESKIELERSNEELEQFAYVASHDLQEPLNNVTSFAALLRTHYADQLDERGKKSIRYIVKGVDHMKDLIEGLLEYSRIGHHRTFEPVDCNKVVAVVRSDLATLLKETNTHLAVDQLPTVKGNKIELRLLFQNLIHNAIKFRKAKTAPRIHVSVKEKANVWEFAVSDNGIGIDPKFKNKPFMIYQRLHVGAAYKGTGIGLAHCKKIVEIHKGKIWYKSKQGKGTTFYFTFKKQ